MASVFAHRKWFLATARKVIGCVPSVGIRCCIGFETSVSDETSRRQLVLGSLEPFSWDVPRLKRASNWLHWRSGPGELSGPSKLSRALAAQRVGGRWPNRLASSRRTWPSAGVPPVCVQVWVGQSVLPGQPVVSPFRLRRRIASPAAGRCDGEGGRGGPLLSSPSGAFHRCAFARPERTRPGSSRAGSNILFLTQTTCTARASFRMTFTTIRLPSRRCGSRRAAYQAFSGAR